MTAHEAAKKLEKLLGPKGAWRTNPKALTAENKPTLEQLKSAREVMATAKAARDARYREVLAQDAEYQRVLAEWRQAHDVVEKMSGDMLGYRVTVGTLDQGVFFMVKAQGDNWADVIRKLEAETKDKSITRTR